jgi:MoaA/NifB/PqqE/SkfB family radical SAM enzyme
LENTLNKIVGIEDNHAPKDELLRVEWNLGKRCNYNCSYCGNELHDKTSDHMPWEVFTNTIDKIRAGSDKKIKISFTGGEPFVNPQFVDMLKYAKDHGVYRCSVTTNGSPPIKIYEKALPYLHYVIISYHFEFAYHEKVINNIVAINKLIEEYKANGDYKGMHVHIMFLPGKLKECIEIINELQANNITYSIRKIRPRVNMDRTGWHRPFEDGMLGQHPKFSEIAIFESQDPYYNEEELNWLKENA